MLEVASVRLHQAGRPLCPKTTPGGRSEVWIPPPEIRDLRELTRYRQKLVGLRSNCKDQVHAVLAKLGLAVACSDLFGAWGSAWMDGLRLPQPYAGKVTSLL